MHTQISRRLLLGAALTAFPFSASAQDKWATYRNTRYGTTIDYPSRFRPGRPPDNNDGLSFIVADGATLSVWGRLNINGYDPLKLETDERENHGAGESIHGAERGDRWFAFRGRRGPDQFFYRHYMLSHANEVINVFEVSYPEALAATYEPIVARMARSFRPGRGYQIKGTP